MSKSCTLMVLCLAMLIFPGSVQAEPLRIAYPEFKPFFFRTDQGKMEGLFYEIVTEALTRMHIETTWEAYPWSRCQALVQGGMQDAMITVPTRERSEYTSTHATPFYRKTMNVFTYLGHPRIKEILGIKKLQDIKNFGFSVITYTTNGWSRDNVASLGITVEETPNLRSVWLMLAHHRGDLVIEWPLGAWPEIQDAGLGNDILDTKIELASMPFHLLVRKSCPLAIPVVQSFDEIMEQMRRDGTMRKILARYADRNKSSD